MENSEDRGGCCRQKRKAEVDNNLRDLQNSSYRMKAEVNNCFIIHSKYFAISLVGFPLTKNKTTWSLGFLGQRFSNLQRAALLTLF